MILETVYPPGGWGRAFNYVYHRLKRLPDPPHRIARGISAGMLLTFSPLFGAHIPGAALLAWGMRGNMIAAMLTTMSGNPITFPFIAVGCLSTGNWMLGMDTHIRFHEISASFRRAGSELWWNLKAIFTPNTAHWNGLADFFRDIFLPYLLGGLLWGAIAAIAAYALAHRAIDAYQRRRSRLLQARLQQRLKSAGPVVAE